MYVVDYISRTLRDDLPDNGSSSLLISLSCMCQKMNKVSNHCPNNSSTTINQATPDSSSVSLPTTVRRSLPIVRKKHSAKRQATAATRQPPSPS